MSSNDLNSEIIVHSSTGLRLVECPSKVGQSSVFESIEGSVKGFHVSDNGLRVAWIANGEVCVVEAPNWNRIGTLQHPKAVEVFFSPSGKYLAVFEFFSQAQGTQPTPNLYIYDVLGKKLLKSFVQKGHEGWKPQWTKDEFLLARMTTSEVHFYEGSNLDDCKQKGTFAKLRSFSLSPSIKTHHCIIFVPSAKSAPGYFQLLKYPHVKESANVVARQSFFKVASVETFWNKACTAVLLLTTGEIDKKTESYYGEQMLFFLSTKGDSNRVTFNKGAIRATCWLPSSKEFLCVYGAAPAKATLFNLKCDPVREFGEGARNFVMINPPGNLVLIGGMGNISSRFEVWDVKDGKRVGLQECPDITHIEWSPCGKYFLTSTCSPRLRVNNGYRVWHYTTTLLTEFESKAKEELLAATWLPDPKMASNLFEISMKSVPGIQFQIKKASNERYIPPSKRGTAATPGAFADNSKKFLSEREVPLSAEEKAAIIKKQKNMEKRNEKKKNKAKIKRSDKGDWREKSESEENQIKQESAPKNTQDKNVAKRIRNIKKKLESIEKLKKDRDSGVELSDVQLKKIDVENSLHEDLNKLEIS